MTLPRDGRWGVCFCKAISATIECQEKFCSPETRVSTLRFLIVDSYPKGSRDEFDVAGIRQGWRLYADMLARHLPEAECCPWFAADSAQPPGSPAEYKGI